MHYASDFMHVNKKRRGIFKIQSELNEKNFEGKVTQASDATKSHFQQVSSILTVNNQPPFVLYCTIRNEWILSSTRQIFSVIIHGGNECQNTQ